MKTRTTRIAPMALAGVLALGLAACADGTDTTGTSDTTDTVDDTATMDDMGTTDDMGTMDDSATGTDAN